jgi:phosphoglycerate-specific signal transduction histidine kinase
MAANQNKGGGDILFEELRQPIAAASNYIAAARLLVAADGTPGTARAGDLLAKAEKELLRAGAIIGKLQSGSRTKGGNSAPH